MVADSYGMASRFNIYSDLVISRNELEISLIHFLISLSRNELEISLIQLMISIELQFREL